MAGLLITSVLVLTSVAPTALARTSYCSPSGDYCTAVVPQGADTVLKLGSFYPFGHYRLCVTAPRGPRVCKRFKMRTNDDISYSNVHWSLHFPDRGVGLYRVRWRHRNVALGPRLAFRRLGPVIKATPNPVHRGEYVRVFGNTGGCRNGLTLLSGAFSREHEFAGVPAVFPSVAPGGDYSISTLIPAARRPGAYVISGRCGGGNMGVSVRLRVLR
jgi:hypothetical protein